MILSIECECGNEIKLSVPSKKYIQFRDNLEAKQFHYDVVEIKNQKPKEIRIHCHKCRNWISLGVD